MSSFNILITETIDDNYFADFPLCSRIRKLDFRWSQLDETHELVSKLTKMVSFFPNLTNMDCDFDAQYYISEKVGIIYLNKFRINLIL